MEVQQYGTSNTAIEIHNGVIFDFYTGLLHFSISSFQFSQITYKCKIWEWPGNEASYRHHSNCNKIFFLLYWLHRLRGTLLQELI